MKLKYCTDNQGVNMYHRLLNELIAVWQCLHVVDTSAVSGGCVSYTQTFFFTYLVDEWTDMLRRDRSVR